MKQKKKLCNRIRTAISRVSRSIGGEDFHQDDERIIRTWDNIRIVAYEYPDEISYAWFPLLLDRAIAV